MKKEVLCNLLYDLYMPLSEDKEEIESRKMSHVDMFFNGVGKFKGLWNMEENKKYGEMLNFKKIHILDDEMYVG